MAVSENLEVMTLEEGGALPRSPNQLHWEALNLQGAWLSFHFHVTVGRQPYLSKPPSLVCKMVVLVIKV